MTKPRKPVNAQSVAIQAALVALVVFLIASGVQNAQQNLDAMGMTSGFGFLERATGWGYSFSLVERSVDDTYARTLSIGFMNTVFLGGLAILTTTALGFLIGTLRDTRNLALQTFAAGFVHIFRNIPLILQLVFWYAVLIHLPGQRQAYSFADSVFLSNRGLEVPVLNLNVGVIALLVLASAAFAIGVFRFSATARTIRLAIWAGFTLALFALAVFALIPDGEPVLSIPELRGLRFRGGVNVSVEFLAMIISITLYGSAYIAEVVRGGLQEVPRGLVEAGQALGLKEATVWWKIKMPMALRTIIPPLGNQWIFMIKATTIGVAIGFSDLFMLISTSITQSGQTLELIFLLVAAFVFINFSLAQLVNWLNARLQLKGH
ncbi:MAG: ABC transporter permease subunit [Pseudomonadota bacterium]